MSLKVVFFYKTNVFFCHVKVVNKLPVYVRISVHIIIYSVSDSKLGLINFNIIFLLCHLCSVTYSVCNLSFIKALTLQNLSFTSVMLERKLISALGIDD